MEQITEFNIDACSCCGEFHRVAWYEYDDDQELLLCDTCFIDYCEKV